MGLTDASGMDGMVSMRFPALLLGLLAICATSSAAIACMNNATEIILGPTYGMQGLILGVIGLTVVIIAAAYAAGSATGNAGMTVFAKDEIYHLGFSILMLMSMSGIMLTSCMVMDFFSTAVFQSANITASSCYSQSATMQSIAVCYAKSATNDAQETSRIYIQKYIDNIMDSTMSWSLQWPLMNSYTSTAASYKRIVSNQYDMILNAFLIPAMLSISMQKLALTFIKDNVVTWFLPTAFLLRVFIPTRQMGNMFIALSLALYIIIPFLYVFNFAMYDSLMDKNDCAKFSGAVCDFVADGGNCTPASVCANKEGFWFIARLIQQAFFLPNMTIAIVITFLASINKVLRVMG
jgi:hypothetical protein